LIWSVHEKFGMFLSEDLVESLNQNICYSAKRKQKNHIDLKAR